MIAGGVTSVTTTLKLQAVEVLFEASVATHDTFVVPLLNGVPLKVPLPAPVVAPVRVQNILDSGTGVGVQLSVAVALNSVPTVTYWHTVLAVLVAGAAGQVITGGVKSLTVTVSVQPLVLPAPSVTTQLTSVTPLLNATPASVPEPVPPVAPVRVHTLLAAGIGEFGQLSVATTSNSVPTAV